MLKKTKIITTWGPSITQKLFSVASLNDPKNVDLVKLARQMSLSAIQSGANCVRLNFSHGSIEEHLIKVSFAKEAAQKLNLPISIMCDTQGPELRIGNITNDQTEIKKDNVVTIFCRNAINGSNTAFSISDSSNTYDISRDIHINDIILIDDGKLKLQVISINLDDGTIVTRSLNSHIIKSKKRVNLPNITYSMPYMNDIDRQNIAVACKNNFDYIAASFISSKKDLLEVRQIIDECGATGKIKLIAKPESTIAIKNIDEIILEADGMMVPRGDLGLEIPYYEVPY
jgi:pyruvate kinase